MLQYEKIDVSEGIDTNKTSASKECMLYQCWYFKDVGFKFEPHVYNKCHDVLIASEDFVKYSKKQTQVKRVNISRNQYRRN